MVRAISRVRQQRLADLIRELRKDAGLTQIDVAKALGRHQPFIVAIETGQRRIDVIELMTLGRIIGFDPKAILDELEKI